MTGLVVGGAAKTAPIVSHPSTSPQHHTNFKYLKVITSLLLSLYTIWPLDGIRAWSLCVTLDVGLSRDSFTTFSRSSTEFYSKSV